MTDLENKIASSLSIQDIMHKYQCYGNMNHPFLLNSKLWSGDRIPLMDYKYNPNITGK